MSERPYGWQFGALADVSDVARVGPADGRTILAIDPGPSRSAYVILADGQPTATEKLPNEEVLAIAENWRGDVTVIEWITVASIAGAEIYQTCRWVGRFEQASAVPVVLLPRADVLAHFFGKRNVKSADSLIRRTMLDRYGGDGAKGVKAHPGPLYGFHADCWSALAVAITYADLHGGAK
jgi:hypothetical protein